MSVAAVVATGVVITAGCPISDSSVEPRGTAVAEVSDPMAESVVELVWSVVAVSTPKLFTDDSVFEELVGAVGLITKLELVLAPDEEVEPLVSLTGAAGTGGSAIELLFCVREGGSVSAEMLFFRK